MSKHLCESENITHLGRNKIHLNQVDIPVTRKTSNNQYQQQQHRSLYDQLNIRFKPENLQHAKLILNNEFYAK